MKQFSHLVARTLISDMGAQAKATVCTWKETSGPFWPGGSAAASCGRHVFIPVDAKIRREARGEDLGQ